MFFCYVIWRLVSTLQRAIMGGSSRHLKGSRWGRLWIGNRTRTHSAGSPERFFAARRAANLLFLQAGSLVQRIRINSHGLRSGGTSSSEGWKIETFCFWQWKGQFVQPLDLKEFEWKTVVRPLTIDDYDALVAMQEKCFPGMQPWGRDQIESQLARFSRGTDLRRDRWATGRFVQQPDRGIRSRPGVAQLEGRRRRRLHPQPQAEGRHAVRHRDHGRSGVPRA